MNNKLPAWFKQDIPEDIALSRMRLLREFNVNTVCKQARCPNQSSCFKNSSLTVMILGDKCTRNCRFCAVGKSNVWPLGIDADEPLRIAEVAKELGLRYAVITSVTRDDLKDGGASVFARVIDLIRKADKDIKIEVLIPDFSGNEESLKIIADCTPEVVGHNMETVKRLYKELRPQSDYDTSLGVLERLKRQNPSLVTKSSLMLGLGETEAEVINAMLDLRHAYCDILALGQYLAPSSEHCAVREFIGIEQFRKYEGIASALGFKAVLSGPLVRSSYRAEEVYNRLCMI